MNMSFGRILAYLAAIFALASALCPLLGQGSTLALVLALAGAAAALAVGLGLGLAGKAGQLPAEPLAAAAADSPASSRDEPPDVEARIADVERRGRAELAEERERARAIGASALRRLKFADSVLKKVPITTEEAAFALMERLAALRDQSSRASKAAVSADSGATNSKAIEALAVGARSTINNVRVALREMRKHDRDAAGGLKALGQELKSGIELLAGIEEITERSRLIAFNMAIEAARIGDKGRGFKVIVGELRALNDRTAEFSKKVTGLLGRFKQYNDSLVEKAITSSLVVAEEVEKGIGQEELAIESLLGASTSCVDLSESVTEVVRKINLELDGVLESLQFQDITRQMIEGALVTMTEAVGELGPLVRRDGLRAREAAQEEERGQLEALRAQLFARAKTRGEKDAIQEVSQ
jgi:hypothetical protein